MIINQELVKKVKEHFNLNIYETKVWLALLSKGVVTAGETADLSGVPRSRTYDVLESLAKRGFAIVKIGKPVKYVAVEPKTVLERMKSNTLHEAQNKITNLSNLKDSPEYDELVQLHRDGISPVRVEDLSGHINGRANILSKIKEITSNSKKELIFHTTAEDFESKSRVLAPLLRNITSSKIKLKISLSGEPHKVRRLASRNELKIQESNKPGKFLISDNKEVLFMLHADNSEDELAVWVSSPYFASSISSIFNKN